MRITTLVPIRLANLLAMAALAGCSHAATPATPSASNGDVEQTTPGTRAPATLVASFDGLGHGFNGPDPAATFRNPSDNSLAVGPDHIVEIVNSRMAVYTKRGARFDTTGRVLRGPAFVPAAPRRSSE